MRPALLECRNTGAHQLFQLRKWDFHCGGGGGLRSGGSNFFFAGGGIVKKESVNPRQVMTVPDPTHFLSFDVERRALGTCTGVCAIRGGAQRHPFTPCPPCFVRASRGTLILRRLWCAMRRGIRVINTEQGEAFPL